jgi:hypothetical protein
LYFCLASGGGKNSHLVLPPSNVGGSVGAGERVMIRILSRASHDREESSPEKSDVHL